MKDEQITIQQALEYEVNSSPWAWMVWWKWGSDMASSYYAWKVRRKHRRYLFWKNYCANHA